MAATVNGIAAAFVGTVGSDPELRFTANGSRLLSFAVAVFDAKRAQDAATEWVRVSCWNELADSLEDSVTKGREVYVEGRLKLNQYTAADGSERSGLQVSAWKLEPLGRIGRQRAPKRPDQYREAFDRKAPAPAKLNDREPWEESA